MTPLSPSLAFWRDLGCRYLDGRCRTPRGADFEPLDLPPTSEWADTLAGAPPMQGGEYLNAFLLERAWRNLDALVREEVAESGGDLSKWLKKNAPMWHQVGRVCFHLAENARDPGLSLCLPGHLRPSPVPRGPRAIPAAEQGPRGACRQPQQEGADRAPLAGPPGLADQRCCQGVGRFG